MVRILANGDIVPDNDPRVHQSRHSGNAPTNRGPHMGTVPHQYDHQGQGAGGQMGQQISIFETLNQRLLGLGIPRFNVGLYNIEPIITVGFLLAMLLFGLPGLLFAGLLFGVVMMSGGGTDNSGGTGVAQGVGMGVSTEIELGEFSDTGDGTEGIEGVGMEIELGGCSDIVPYCFTGKY